MKINRIVKNIFKQYIKHKVSLKEKRKVKEKIELFKNIVLTEEQTNSIDEIWMRNYGKKISKNWHRLYTSYTGKFDKYYFPEIFFTTNLLEKLNPERRKEYLADKILTKELFSGIENEKLRLMKNYVYNCNGYFYDNNGIITYDEALAKISNIGEVIIKPSVETSSGNNVDLLNIKDGIDEISGRGIEEIFKKYNMNYMVQEKLKQHESFAKLNPSSVNTIRINTYICEGKLYSSPIAMRIGRYGSIVDNGNLFIGVKENGELRKFAFTKFDGQKFAEHPDTKIKFENYKLPMIPQMVNFAKKYHYKIPHMGIIAWDLALDKDENIVIIEANISCPSVWFPQYCNGEPFFGKNTEKMIRMLKEKGK